MSKPPFTLVIAAVVIALEGLCVLGLGGYVAVLTVVGEPHDLASSIAESAIGVIVGAALIWVAWGAYGAQRWSRSPGVLTQVFALPVAITLIQSGRQVAGAALLAAALTAIVTLLAPPSTRVLYDGAFPDGGPEDAGKAAKDSGTGDPGDGPAKRRSGP
ncbi:MAG: hypothetical protein DIU60_002415 [Actinomycetes bacterium]